MIMSLQCYDSSDVTLVTAVALSRYSKHIKYVLLHCGCRTSHVKCTLSTMQTKHGFFPKKLNTGPMTSTRVNLTLLSLSANGIFKKTRPCELLFELYYLKKSVLKTNFYWKATFCALTKC